MTNNTIIYFGVEKNYNRLSQFIQLLITSFKSKIKSAFGNLKIFPHLMWLICIALADTKNVQRKNITNCYDETTNIKLNLNTYTLTLGLNPTNKTECHEIEQSVFVNLTLHANNYICDNITILLLNFSYLNTKSIEYNFYKDTKNIFNINDVFCNASLPEDEYLQGMPELTFAFVQIYTHSHIMSTEVMEYSQIKTNISGCFERLFVQMTDDYKLNLSVKPTLVCKNLINKKPNSTNNSTPDNYISDIELIFGDITFKLNETQMDEIIDKYDELKEAQVQIEGYNKIIQLADSDYNNGQMRLTTIQNGVSVQILYNIIFSQVSVRPFFHYAVFAGGEETMFFQYDADKNAAANITADTSKPFTNYKYKLIITQGNDYITYQRVINSAVYDPSDSIWIIDCNTMTGYQRDQCLNYSEFIRTSKDVDVQLCVSFYDEDHNFLFHEQVSMVQELACIKELEVRYVNKKYIRAISQIDNQTICQEYLKYKLDLAYILVANTNFKGEYKDLYITNKSISSLTRVEFHCVDGEPCQITPEYIKMAQTYNIFLGIELKDSNNKTIKFAVSTNKLSLENPDVINYTSLGIGIAAVVACLIMTLYGMVMTMKRVKLIKKKKLKL